jgi:two-component system sensor histidine kinase DesK
MILGVVDPSSIGVGDEERRWSSRFIRLATLGAVAFSVLLPVNRVYDIAVLPASYGGIKGRAVYAVIAFACYLPVQVWLVLSATRGAAGRWQRLGLLALAAVMFGLIPVVGVGWVGILYMLGALVLASLRPPWSLLLYAALVATPAPLSLALGQPEWAVYFTVGMLIFPVPLAVGIWLIRGAWHLQQARLALAEQAVIRERLRIDGEVRASVGAELASIAAQGQRASKTAAQDPSTAVRELHVLVDDARRTLAETRQMVTRYREVSLMAELRTVAMLLSAAGIDAHLELAPGLPDTVDDRDRASLRQEVARLLVGENDPAHSVTIAATPHDGRLRIELRIGPSPKAAEVAAG